VTLKTVSYSLRGAWGCYKQDSIPIDAAVGSEGAMFSTIECISQSVYQTESLVSNVPVMRLRGGAHRNNNF
jgi:hypothetical protein